MKIQKEKDTDIQKEKDTDIQVEKWLEFKNNLVFIYKCI